MSQKELKKIQSQNKQQAVPQELQTEQGMPLWQMPFAEVNLETSQEKLEKEMEDIEKKLQDLSDEEWKKEQEIGGQQAVLSALHGNVIAAKEKAKQNPESANDYYAFIAHQAIYEREQKMIGEMIKQLFNIKHEKFIQLRNHQTKMLMYNGEKLTDAWSDQTAADGIERIINDLQKYTQEPWNACAENILVTMDKLQHARQNYLDRIEMTKTARHMEEETEDYSHKQQLLEWTAMKIPPEEVLNEYLENVNQLWKDKSKREIYLSPEHITHHIRESFFLIDYYLFFKSRRKGIKIPKEKKAAVERADCIMNYYHEHVKNILSDYGMNMSKMRYDRKKLEDATKEETTAVKAEYWRKDFQIYQDLTGESQWEDLTPRKEDFSEDMIIRLEEQFGIVHEDIKTESQMSREERPEDFVNRENGYYRYKSDILDSMADYRSAVAKKRRIWGIGQAMIHNLQDQGLGRQLAAFNRILDYLYEDCQNLDEINRKTYKECEKQEDIIREKLMGELHQILKLSNSSLEKQYAAELFNFFKKEQTGDLIVPDNSKNIIYRSDKMFELEGDISRYTVSMKSAKNQPLFSHDPILKDFAQGQVGDCYFVAAVASLVTRTPNKIKDIMRDNGDGTVTVRFYDREKKKHLYVKVDKTIPEREYRSRQTTAHGAEGALWFKLLEKAYISVRDGKTKKLTNRSGKCSYKNGDSGRSSIVFADLMGMEIDETDYDDESSFFMFKGRLKNVKIFGDFKLDTPALLYYEKTHKGDKAAFDYLSKHRVPKRKKEKLKEELQRNNKVEELLQRLMMKEKHELQINVMDHKEFEETMAKAFSKLAEYSSIADTVGTEGQTMEIQDLAKTNIPEEMRSLLAECWNICGKQKKALEHIAFDMIEIYMEKISTTGVNMAEYTSEEEEYFNKIEGILHGQKFCALGSKHFKIEEGKKQAQGSSGEDYLDGIFGGHAYAVLRTEIHQIGNKTKKFLRLANPHGANIPLYQLGADQKLKRVAFLPKGWNEEASQYQDNTHGVFFVELRDARNFFRRIFSAK